MMVPPSNFVPMQIQQHQQSLGQQQQQQQQQFVQMPGLSPLNIPHRGNGAGNIANGNAAVPAAMYNSNPMVHMVQPVGGGGGFVQLQKMINPTLPQELS